METLRVVPIPAGFALCRGRHVVETFELEFVARRELRHRRVRWAAATTLRAAAIASF